MSLYRLIDEESQRQSVSRLCRTLGVTRSGYYDWQGQPLSDRALADWLLTEQIRGTHYGGILIALGRWFRLARRYIAANPARTPEKHQNDRIWPRARRSRHG